MPRISDWLGSVRAAFGSAAAVDTRVRWFGKLPTYRDYVRSPDEPRWAQEFTEGWLLKGFAAWEASESFRAAGRLAPALGVVQISGFDACILFAMRDFGGDSTGTRRFPFCLFTAVQSKSISANPMTAWMGWSALLMQLRKLSEGIGEDWTPEMVAAFMPNEGILPSADTDTVVYGPLLWCSWFEQVGPRLATPMSEAAWRSALLGWGERIRAHATEAYSLQFPLSDHDWAEQTSGWLEWVATRVQLQTSKISILIREAHSLNLLARAVEPTDFLLLTPADSQLRYVDSAERLELPASCANFDASPAPEIWRVALQQAAQPAAECVSASGQALPPETGPRL